MKKIICSLFVLLMLIGLTTNPVSADERYNYTIEVSGGLYGQVDGKDEEFFTVESGKGYRFNTNNIKVTVKDEYADKYAFLGFHVAGRVADEIGDGSEQLVDTFNSVGDFLVNKDLMLVATFGVKSKLVAYYIRYVDENGYELLPQDTLYGNAGDKPVVAYRYISGYLPNTYHYTGTIPTKDATPLTFTFVYHELDNGDDDGTELEPLVVYVYPTRVGPTNESQGPVRDDGTSETDEGVEEIIEYVEPDPIIDVDPNPQPEPEPEPEPEEKTLLETIGDMIAPLTNWINETMETNPVLGVASIIGMSLLVFGIIGLLIFLFMLLFKRKKDDEEKPQEA